MEGTNDLAGFVKASHYREEVLKSLLGGPATPSEIAAATANATPHISRALVELREEGLVDLLVDEERKKGRLYQITSQGKESLAVFYPVAGSGTTQPDKSPDTSEQQSEESVDSETTENAEAGTQESDK